MNQTIRCNALRPYVVYVAGELWQYDTGQTLLIEGLSWMTDPVSVQFSTSEDDGPIIEVEGTATADGILANIPDALLCVESAEEHYNIYVRTYVESESGKKLVASFSMRVYTRRHPGDNPG